MKKINANEISEALLEENTKNGDINIPNYYWAKTKKRGYFECDIFRISGSEYVIEYEIKVSRTDFNADFDKKRQGLNKHDQIKNGKRCNRFYYVTPCGLLNINEIPEYCGLIEYTRSNIRNYFTVIKPAPLLHKDKVSDDYYKIICKKLVQREINLKNKFKRLKTTLKK